MIELRNVHTGYRNVTLLDGVNLSLSDGTMTALVGRNGCGKSTLLRSIAGLSSDYTGEITVDGVNVKHRQRLARHLAFVNTSRVRVPDMLCRHVVALGRAPYTGWMGSLSNIDHKAVEEALAKVGMEDFADRQLDTLSDGECQRVMIARALAQDTTTIVLDEPTSFLDIPGRRRVMQLLANLAHDDGKCILMSTHEVDLAMRNADYLAVISPNEHPSDARGSLSLLGAADPETAAVIERTFS